MKSCLLYPDSCFLWVWDILLAISLLYLALVMPVQIVFFNSDNLFFFILEPVFTIFFFADIFVNFFRVYVNKKGKMITSKAKIAKKYLSFWFWVDLVAFFPMYIFVDKFRNLNNWIKVLKFSKMFNLVEIIRSFKLLKYVCRKEKWKTLIGYRFFKTNQEHFFLQVLGNFLIVHLTSCLVYAIPVYFSPDLNWVVNRDLMGRSVFEKYLYSLHWMIETCITVGYGEMPFKCGCGVSNFQNDSGAGVGHFCDVFGCELLLFHD